MDQEKANQMLEFLLTTLQQTKSFTLEQAPLVVQEVLSYGLFQATFLIWTCAIILAIGVGFIIAEFFDDSYSSGGKLMIGMVFATLSTVGLICNIAEKYKIEHAPRLYILEQVRGSK